MNVAIDRNYKAVIDKLRLKNKKYACLFNTEDVLRFDFRLEEENISIVIQKAYSSEAVTYLYKELLRCEVRSNGYVIIFKDKRFIFLPVTNDEDSNAELLEIGEDFNMRYSGFRFVESERLCLPAVESENSNKKSVRIGFGIASFPVVIFVSAIISIVMASVFIMMRDRYKIIDAGQCGIYAGVIERYSQDDRGYIDLYFEDGSIVSIHQSCAHDEVIRKLEAVNKGETLHVLVNPETDFAVEIKTDSYEILNIDTSQNQMLKEATGFMCLGIILYIGAVFLIIYGVVILVKEHRNWKS